MGSEIPGFVLLSNLREEQTIATYDWNKNVRREHNIVSAVHK